VPGTGRDRPAALLRPAPARLVAVQAATFAVVGVAALLPTAKEQPP